MKWVCYKYKGYWIRRDYCWDNYWTVERDCKILSWHESEQACKEWIIAHPQIEAES